MSLSAVRYQRLRGLAGELAQVAVECFAGNCWKSDDPDTGREFGGPKSRLTADTYGHVLPTRARQAATAIDRALGKGSA